MSVSLPVSLSVSLSLCLTACTGDKPADSAPPTDSPPADSDSGDTDTGDSGDTDTGDTGTPAPDPVINEFMPDNAQAWAGPEGTYPDWIEIHNPGDATLSLEGWALADDPDAAPSVLGGLEIAAGGLIVLIADGDPAAGPTHLGFSLDSGGEEIVLWAPDGRRAAWLEFPDLPGDVAAARTSGGWIYVAGGSPGSPNPE